MLKIQTFKYLKNDLLIEYFKIDKIGKKTIYFQRRYKLKIKDKKIIKSKLFSIFSWGICKFLFDEISNLFLQLIQWFIHYIFPIQMPHVLFFIKYDAQYKLRTYLRYLNVKI